MLGKESIPNKSGKDLGVIFYPKLSFDKHILTALSSCVSSLYQINRASHAFSKSLLVTVINALFTDRSINRSIKYTLQKS